MNGENQKQEMTDEERAAAEKAEADKEAADKAAAEKAEADKEAADKAAAEKAEADKAAKKSAGTVRIRLRDAVSGKSSAAFYYTDEKGKKAEGSVDMEDGVVKKLPAGVSTNDLLAAGFELF